MFGLEEPLSFEEFVAADDLTPTYEVLTLEEIAAEQMAARQQQEASVDEDEDDDFGVALSGPQ